MELQLQSPSQSQWQSQSQHIITITFSLLLLIIAVLIYYICTNTNNTNNTNSKRENMFDSTDSTESIYEYTHTPSRYVYDYFDEECKKGNFCNKNKLIDHAEHFSDNTFQPDYAWLSQYNLMPWWNSTRSTRNMSYDLRGDIPIVPSYVGPWNNSPLI